MKKVQSFIKNLYRIVIVRPGKRAISASYSQTASIEVSKPYLYTEAQLKKIIHDDQVEILPDESFRKSLEMRVSRKRKEDRSELRQGSFAGLILPWVTFKNLEMKMLVITLLFLVTLMPQPKQGIHSLRQVYPTFLADTLIDSSVLKLQIELGIMNDE